MKERKELLVFTKNTVLGTVKTRIGKEKGDEIALKVYENLLTFTKEVVLKVDCHKTVFFNSFIEKEGIWDDKFFDKKLQVVGNLGMKMSAAFEDALKSNSKAIIIGSDCAEISSETITRAFEQLESYDVVIGPATDGGYYLLGMKKYHKFIFDNMPWSHEKLFEATSQVIEHHKLTLKILDMKSDIDYWKDWEKLGWDL